MNNTTEFEGMVELVIKRISFEPSSSLMDWMKGTEEEKRLNIEAVTEEIKGDLLKEMHTLKHPYQDYNGSF